MAASRGRSCHDCSCSQRSGAADSDSPVVPQRPHIHVHGGGVGSWRALRDNSDTLARPLRRSSVRAHWHESREDRRAKVGSHKTQQHWQSGESRTRQQIPQSPTVKESVLHPDSTWSTCTRRITKRPFGRERGGTVMPGGEMDERRRVVT